MLSKEGNPQKQALSLNELTAISILNGRNRKDVEEIAPFVSEYNIIRTWNH